MHDEPGCEECNEQFMDSFIGEDGNIKADIKISLNNDNLSEILNREIEQRFTKTIIKSLDLLVQRKAEELINTSYRDGLNVYMKNAIDRVVEKRFKEKYPEVLEDKVDSILEQVKNHQFNTDRYNLNGDRITDVIRKGITKYIDNEFKEVVSKTKEGIDAYAQNYFSKNLFRAMGLMSNFTDEEGTKKLQG